MPVLDDVLRTTFVVIGAQQTISELGKASRAYESFQKNMTGLNPIMMKAMRDSMTPLEKFGEKLGPLKEATVEATAFYGILRKVTGELRNMVDQYVDFGRQVMNVKQLTGGTTDQAAAMVNMMQASGVSPNMLMREIAMMSRSATTPRGQQALKELGVDNKSGESGLDYFGRVKAALDKMPDGMKKTNAEMAIFGQRGVQYLAPVLRLSSDFMRLNKEFSTGMEGNLGAIQDFSEQWSLMGEGFRNQVIFPIARILLPALTKIVEVMDFVIEKWQLFNELTHGVGSMVLTFGLLVVGVGAFAMGLIKVIEVGKMLIDVLKVLDAWEAIQDALIGNWKAIAAAGVIAAGAVAYGAATSNNSGSSSAPGSPAQGDNVANNTGALQENTRALREFHEAFGPHNLREGDVTYLLQQGKLQAIG